MTTPDIARNQWYPVAIEHLVTRNRPETIVLMGEQLTIHRMEDDSLQVTGSDGRVCPVTLRYGHVWSSIGAPGHALRVVENFLDIAHFPFVHTDVLGAEPHTEVEPYKVEIRDTVDEVWATKVRFFQPQAAKSAGEGQMTDYMYRVPAPCVSILYKTCPPRPGAWDVIALFVRPISEVLCDAYAWMALYDDDSAQSDLIQFQQMIFLQDRSILENQLPSLLPLDPKMEIPTRADTTSIAYRRWLKRQGMSYGAQLVAR